MSDGDLVRECEQLRKENDDLRAQLERAEEEAGLLFDALSLDMRSKGISAEAHDKVDEYRAVIKANGTRVQSECDRLTKVAHEQQDRAERAEAELDREKASTFEVHQLSEKFAADLDDLRGQLEAAQRDVRMTREQLAHVERQRGEHQAELGSALYDIGEVRKERDEAREDAESRRLCLGEAQAATSAIWDALASLQGHFLKPTSRLPDDIKYTCTLCDTEDGHADNCPLRYVDRWPDSSEWDDTLIGNAELTIELDQARTEAAEAQAALEALREMHQRECTLKQGCRMCAVLDATAQRGEALRAERERVWDEGFRHGHDHGRKKERWRSEPRRAPANPYAAQSENTEVDGNFGARLIRDAQRQRDANRKRQREEYGVVHGDSQPEDTEAE